MDGDAEWKTPIGSLPDTLRPEDLPKFNEGLRFLLTELREAAAAFNGEDNGRDAVIGLVAAMAAFVRLFHSVRDETLAPFLALGDALSALDQGLVDPLLRPAPRPKGGRARANDMRHRLRGAVAYTVRASATSGTSLQRFGLL